MSQQLDVMLDSSPVAAPARLKKYKAEVQRLRSEVSSLREQLAHSQAEHMQPGQQQGDQQQ